MASASMISKSRQKNQQQSSAITEDNSNCNIFALHCICAAKIVDDEEEFISPFARRRLKVQCEESLLRINTTPQHRKQVPKRCNGSCRLSFTRKSRGRKKRRLCSSLYRGIVFAFLTFLLCSARTNIRPCYQNSKHIIFLQPFGKSVVQAVSASPHPYRHRQPDGTLTPPLYLKGNHFFHITTDEHGYTIVDDGDWKVYGTLNETSGKLEPTHLKVGVDDPRTGEKNGFLRGTMEMPNWEIRRSWDSCGKFCIDSREWKRRYRHLYSSTNSIGVEIKNGHENRTEILSSNTFEVKNKLSNENRRSETISSLPSFSGSNRRRKKQGKFKKRKDIQGDRGTLRRGRGRQNQEDKLFITANKYRNFIFAADGKKLKRQTKVSRNQVSTNVLKSKKDFARGTLKNIVVLIRFSDHVDRDLPTAQEIDVLMNKVGGHPMLAPTGSVRDYFLQSSYNKLNVVSTVRPWFTLPDTEAYYADGTSGATDRFENALRLVLEHMDEDESFSFSDYDLDGDKEVDAIMFLHSGYGAEWGGFDCEGQNKRDRIWAHKWNIQPSWLSKNDVSVSKYHTSSALWSTCGKEIARIGTICHEIGHVLSLPDLYSTGSGVGSFGVMGNSWGFDGSQLYPPIMCPWSKIQLGWLDPKEIKSNGKYTIEASAVKPDVYIIKNGYPGGEYILIENRQSEGFDAHVAQGGIIVWHIDEHASENKPGHPDQLNWPFTGDHYRVSILQADGKYDLEKGHNRGDSTDVWHADSSPGYLGPSTSRLGPYPNTDAYQKGNIIRTGNKFFDFSKSGTKMTFQVTLDNIHGNGNQVVPIQNPTTSEPTISPRPGPSISIMKEITTTMDGGNGSFGNMFDVRSISGKTLVVKTLLFHTRSKDPFLEVKVYTKPGSHVNSPKHLWTIVAETSVAGQGYMKRTAIPETEFNDVYIEAGETQAFYITLKNPHLRYTNEQASKLNTAFTSNLDMEILVGTGVGGDDFGQRYPSRVFNGSVKYSIDNGGKLNSLSGISNEPTKTLSTTYAHDNGSYGSMFEVSSLVSITITSLDIHTKTIGRVKVEIWTKKGSYTNYEQTQSAWTNYLRIDVESKGKGLPTPIPPDLFPPMTMEAGERRAFYITLETPDLRYTNGLIPARDEFLQISGGLGIGGYPFGPTYYPRAWNGSIRYVVNGDSISSDVTSSSKSGETNSLLTTFANGNGSYGSQFDIIASNDIVITSLDIHTSSQNAISVEVYSRKGSHYGSESDPYEWGEPIFQMILVGQGNKKPTKLPSENFSSVQVFAGETQAFYVTLKTSDLRYTNGLSLGRTHSANSDLRLLEGTGVGSYKFGKTFSPRVFNGIIHYKPGIHFTSDTLQLKSTFRGGTGAYGNMFDIETKNEIEIESISFHTDSIENVFVEVWSRSGSYKGYENSLNGWELLAKVAILGAGKGNPTKIPNNSFTAIKIPQFSVHSFYVTLHSAKLRYTKGAFPDQAFSQNNDLSISTGIGIAQFPPGIGSVYSPRVWNGIIHYKK